MAGLGATKRVQRSGGMRNAGGTWLLRFLLPRVSRRNNSYLIPESTNRSSMESALQAFVAEKDRRTGPMRTLQSYSRILMRERRVSLI